MLLQFITNFLSLLLPTCFYKFLLSIFIRNKIPSVFLTNKRVVNPELYEGSDCYDPAHLESLIEHHHQENDTNNLSHTTHLHNFNQNPNFESQNDYHHLINMEMEHQNQIIQDLNWTTNTTHSHDQISTENIPNIPRCSNSSISFSNPTHIDQSSYNPLLPLNLQPQPPFFRELIHSLQNGYNSTGGGSIFGKIDMERDNQLYHEGDGILKFSNDINGIVGKGRDVKDTGPFATEKRRRQQLNDKFDALRKLIPNPTMPDRASVVGDAIEYIKELKRMVAELAILVERKRCNRGRMQKHKTEDDSTLDVESISTRPNGGGDHDQGYNGNPASTLRSSWLQRKSKTTEVDVRIIDDEVTIKLVQQKRINCFLFVTKVLDELQLDLNHVAGGLNGDFYSYLFNTKICEGSSVYASAIANKLIEVVDRHYASIPAATGY